MNIIGKNIKRLRQAAGLSQGQVAKELGISIPAFSKIETGITDPNFSRILQIAAFFDEGVDVLIYSEGQAPTLKHAEQHQSLLDVVAQAKEEVAKLQTKVISLYEQLESR